MEDKTQNTELVTQNADFKPMVITKNDLEQLNGITLEFPQLKIPAGGSTIFDVDDEPMKEIKGVIVAHGPMNVYFANEFDGSSLPPDCTSRDGVIGNYRLEENEDGFDEKTFGQRNCADCPFSEFGSGKNGGKACKEKHQLFILTSDATVPYSLLLPVSSTSVLNSYATKLFTKGKYLSDVLTSFTLEKAQNKTGISYSKIVMKKVRDLNDDEKAICKQCAEMVRQING